MSRCLATTIALVRAWTRLYTSGLDPTRRDARRAEIESDLWESHEDARRCGYPATGVALQILARLLLGVPHDLLWCIEHRPRRTRQVFCAAMIAAAAVVFLATFWIVSALQGSPPPVPPPSMVFIAAPPPPPPPPPGSVVGREGWVTFPPPEPPHR